MLMTVLVNILSTFICIALISALLGLWLLHNSLLLFQWVGAPQRKRPQIEHVSFVDTWWRLDGVGTKVSLGPQFASVLKAWNSGVNVANEGEDCTPEARGKCTYASTWWLQSKEYTKPWWAVTLRKWLTYFAASSWPGLYFGLICQ